MNLTAIALLAAGLCSGACHADDAPAPHTGGRPLPVKIHPIQEDAKNVVGGRPPPIRVVPRKPRQTPVQAANWSRMMADIKKQPHAAGLFVLGTNYTPIPGSFPMGAGMHRLYAAPQFPVPFLLRLDGPAGAMKFVVQVATEQTAQHLAPPYSNWSKPQGLVWSQEFKAAVRSMPKSPADKAFDTVSASAFTPETVKLSNSAKYVYFETVLPIAQLAKPGTNLYVRVVPLSGHEVAPTVVAPASNWVQFYVDISQSAQAKIIADMTAAQAKAEADKVTAAENAEKAKQKQEVLTKIHQAQQAIAAAYEIRLLSYIPPKFWDDEEAQHHFIARRETTIIHNGGKSAVNLTKGTTYSLLQVRNMLQSNKTWTQNTWDLASATLNMASSGYTAAKTFAIDTMAAGIDEVPGMDCPPPCRSALSAGLNLALAACGLPPTIPNIDELYAHGLDYMAATLADVAVEQMTGIAVGELGAGVMSAQETAKLAKPPVKEGIKSLLQQITFPAPHAEDTPETWGVPAPFFRQHPAMLYLEIRRKPGSPLPQGQSWQTMALNFDREFHALSGIALPRTVEDKLRIPVALATLDGPEGWTWKGVAPDANVRGEAAIGQPLYGERGLTTIGLWTRHRLPNGVMFNVPWPAIKISTGFIHAIALPDKTLTPSQLDAALKDSTLQLVPDNYFGKTRLRWFSP